MKTIGILGCGWLGVHLSQFLLHENYQVKGSTTSPTKLQDLKDKGITPYLVDLQHPNDEQIHAFLQDIDTLVLTIPPLRGEESTAYQEHFQRILPYIEQNKVEKVIMMSSVSVYAPSKEIITESYTQYSNDPTSRQILEAEEVLRSAPAIHSCILRLGGLFGPDRKPVRYIVNREVLDNPELPINMIHINDIVQFTTALIAQGFEQQVTYNLVSPHYTNRLDYYTREAEELQLTLPPLGENDWTTYRKISGEQLVKQTGLAYEK